MNKQIKHELDCMERGTQKYFSKQDKLRDKGALDRLDSMQRLQKSSITNIAEALEELTGRRTRGLGGKYSGILKRAAQRVADNGEVYEDWNAVAYIGVQALFQSQGPEGKNKVIQVVNSIATRLEADLKCRMFEAAHPAYYQEVLDSFERDKVEQYQHKHRVMMMKFNEFNLSWEDWSNVERVQVGVRVLRCCLEVLDEVFYSKVIVTRGKASRIIETTVAGDEWLAEVERNIGHTRPLFEPCLEKPLDWSKLADGTITGGYHHHKMQSLFPFIKAFDKTHKDYLREGDPQHHMRAINQMQATKWAINKPVLAVQEAVFRLGLGIGLPDPTPKLIPEFPSHLAVPKEVYTVDMDDELSAWKGIAKGIHTANKINKGKVLSYANTLDLARRYKEHDHFHFVYNCDFRGRIYCATSGLSPQGEDASKGLLRFSEGVPLGHEGIRWLAIQAANVYGNDKCSYDDRVQWLRDNETAVRLAVEDPIGNREWWSGADKPWQFLAALFDWAACDYGRNPHSLSYVPVGLDGSCNGLQHYSAMLRDSVGGSGVNLLDSEIPSDIYQDVADVCTTKLSRLSMEFQELWRMIGISRKCAKRPVMTLPYGSTQQSCRAYIYEYVLDNKDKIPNADDRKLWELSKALTPLMWESIGEVVIAARAGMDYLQSLTSSIIRNTEKPISWLTPINFPVYQRYVNKEEVKIDTQLCGRIRLTVHNDNMVGVNSYRQRNGIAPNFVHSIDSTHMVLTIDNCPDHWDLAMIHDDFGTHAGRTQDLYRIIREQFVRLYTETDPLHDWWAQQGFPEGRLPMPDKGELDITDVLRSTYFFG